MDRLTASEVTVFLLSLSVLLGMARVFGELARRLNQPAVLGEIIAGILLGPTVLGGIAPEITSTLFPTTGSLALAQDGLTTLAITLFLLVAGMEVDLSTVWRQGRAAINVSIAGMVIPFAIGYGIAWYLPGLIGHEPGQDEHIYALFFATALSISALPVIAKTLMDMGLYRSDLGMLVVAAAILNDLVGWIIFAIILGMMGATAASHGPSVGTTIWMTLLFAVFALTIGRWLINRILPWLQAHTSWPGGVLAFALSLALAGAAYTESIGIHAIFGSFLVGIALGDSPHLREQTRSIIDRFVSFIFAPLFFASIGLKVNFVANFDLGLVAVVLVVATAGKVLGCGIGGRLSGLAPREAWAVGFGMNARGAMEIILGLLALQAGVIRERMFVALVVMALVTSMMSGPLMERILKRKKPRRLIDVLVSKAFQPALAARDREEAIAALARGMALGAPVVAEHIAAEVWKREQIMATGLGNGLAVPHARIEGLAAPYVAIGMSRDGIDFDAPDGVPARVIFLLVTPADDDVAQLELLADIARTFGREEVREKALAISNYTELLALIRSEHVG